jgi:hypothetical protein
MSVPLVSIITPIGLHRLDELERVKLIAEAQTYPNIEHLICADDLTIGRKRNTLCQMAKGTYIVAMDSDDNYAIDWVEKSVQWLEQHNADITGLSSLNYRHYGQLYRYDYTGSQKYVTEGTMCFRRSVWLSGQHFGDTSSGEGHKFLEGSAKIVPHDYILGFEAVIHGKNTDGHLALHRMKLVKE